MSIIIKVVAVVVGVFVMLQSLRACRKRMLDELYATLWIIGGAGLVILGVFPSIIVWVADIINVFWPPSLLIFFLLVIAFLLLFSHSKVITKLNGQITEITMQYTILKDENNELKQYIMQMQENQEDKVRKDENINM